MNKVLIIKEQGLSIDPSWVALWAVFFVIPAIILIVVLKKNKNSKQKNSNIWFLVAGWIWSIFCIHSLFLSSSVFNLNLSHMVFWGVIGIIITLILFIKKYSYGGKFLLGVFLGGITSVIIIFTIYMVEVFSQPEIFHI